jgi:hypothetical protein
LGRRERACGNTAEREPRLRDRRRGFCFSDVIEEEAEMGSSDFEQAKDEEAKAAEEKLAQQMVAAYN